MFFGNKEQPWNQNKLRVPHKLQQNLLQKKKTTEFPSEKEEEKSIKAQTLMDSGWCC